jgi:lipopolysaccharide export system permease protein
MILFRYICREIYLCLLIIMIILVSILVINEFSHFLKGAAAGKYSVTTVMMFVGLQLPPILTYILPLALFLGILIAIGRLYTDHEMTVMSACGMSLLRQTMIVMSLAAVVAVFSGWLSLWVNPRAMATMSDMRIRVLNNFQVGTLMPHRFEDFGNGRVVYVNKTSHADNKVHGVFLALANKDRAANGSPKWDIIEAHDAYQAKQPNTHGKFVIVQNGTRYEGVAGSANLTVSHFKRYGINIASNLIFGQNHHKRTLVHKEIVPTMTTSELLHYINKDKLADAEWQLRIAIPISILIASLVAVALSEVDPRRGRYFNFIPALGLYIFYSCMIFLSRSWIKSGALPANIGMWWIHGLMLLIAILLFAYRIGWKRIQQLAGVAA